MKNLLIIFISIFLLGSCTLKKKTSSSSKEQKKENIDLNIETIKKELRNPGTNLLLGDRITRDGDSFKPIERTVRGSDNTELKLTVTESGEIDVSFTKPADTVLTEKTNFKIKSETDIKTNNKSKSEIKNGIPFTVTLIVVLLIFLSVLFLLYKLRIL